jgi:hypothetical protein
MSIFAKIQAAYQALKAPTPAPLTPAQVAAASAQATLAADAAAAAAASDKINADKATLSGIEGK